MMIVIFRLRLSSPPPECNRQHEQRRSEKEHQEMQNRNKIEKKENRKKGKPE